MLLRSDGTAVAIRRNVEGRCSIPPLDQEITYTHISAGGSHTVLLRSDGTAVAIGCTMQHTTYRSGNYIYSRHTVLLRSDGFAVSIRKKYPGKCSIPLPEPGLCYEGDLICGRHLALQLEFAGEGDAVTLICSTLSGEERFRLTVEGVDSAWETHKRIAREMNANLPNLQLVLPDGQLVAKVCRANPGASVAEVSQRTQNLQLAAIKPQLLN